MNQPTSLKENCFAFTVFAGGGIYRGVQFGCPDFNIDDVVLFDDPSAPKSERSTMGLTPRNLTAENVRVKIQEQREAYDRAARQKIAEFEAFAEKAGVFVFRQFNRRQRASA
jgi:hypothetical protein